jgi:chromosome segregation ATPase
MTTTTRHARGSAPPAGLSTVRGQIEALERQRDNLLHEIADVDAKHAAVSAEADKAERALADDAGSAEVVTAARARVQAYARKSAELRAKLAPIEEALAPKRAVIARENELNRQAAMVRRAAALWKDVERRRIQASAVIRQALESVAEPQRELAALQEEFSQALGREYATAKELDALLAELQRRGASDLAPMFTRHSFSTITDSIKGFVRVWRLDATPVEFGYVLDGPRDPSVVGVALNFPESIRRAR